MTTTEISQYISAVGQHDLYKPRRVDYTTHWHPDEIVRTAFRWRQAAATILNHRGWVQHSPDHDDERIDLLDALLIATQDDTCNPFTPRMVACWRFLIALISCSIQQHHPLDHGYGDFGEWSIVDWNDQPERSYTDVVDVLRMYDADMALLQHTRQAILAAHQVRHNALQNVIDRGWRHTQKNGPRVPLDQALMIGRGLQPPPLRSPSDHAWRLARWQCRLASAELYPPGIPHGRFGIREWNRHPDRTLDEIVNVLQPRPSEITPIIVGQSTSPALSQEISEQQWLQSMRSIENRMHLSDRATSVALAENWSNPEDTPQP